METIEATHPEIEHEMHVTRRKWESAVIDTTELDDADR